MITINQLFTLLINCVILGNLGNIEEICTLPEMESTPYIAVSQDENLPTFDEALWYTFPFENTLKTNFEILIKNDEILQAGVEIYFYADKSESFTDVFYELYNLSIEEFGNPEFSHIASIPEYQISDLRTYNFKYNDKLLYISTSKTMGIPNIIFRSGNTEYYK